MPAGWGRGSPEATKLQGTTAAGAQAVTVGDQRQGGHQGQAAQGGGDEQSLLRILFPQDAIALPCRPFSLTGTAVPDTLDLVTTDPDVKRLTLLLDGRLVEAQLGIAPSACAAAPLST